MNNPTPFVFLKYTFAIPIMVLAALLFSATANAATTTACVDPAFTTSRTPGFYGHYYNLSEGDPGMVAYSGKPVPNATVGADNYWYNQEYFAFGRVDSSLNFGKKFLPVNTGKKGDPYFFAVHWRALAVVSENGNYTFTMTADDDGWLLIDDKLVIDLNGIHSAKTGSTTVALTAGNHTIDIYYAERGRGSAVFNFTGDKRLSFYALPKGCTTTSTSSTSGRVLGDTTSRLPYTKAVALYKTATSPAVYAILVNGERHYISSPEAFRRYGYSFAKIKTVSRDVLNKYPETRLVRSPEKATVYLFSPRSNGQWLKMPIPTPTAFVSYNQNDWGNLSVVDELDINSYPNATLIRAKGQEVFLLQKGQRRRFTSPAVLVELGYSSHEVIEITPAHLESFTLGEPIG